MTSRLLAPGCSVLAGALACSRWSRVDERRSFHFTGSTCEVAGQWSSWRARTLQLKDGEKTVDIFGVVHHNVYVADQCANFIRSRKPKAVLLEQDPENLQRRLSVYKDELKTKKKTLTNIWETASVPGMTEDMRQRLAAGFCGLIAEDLRAFEAMEDIALDPSDAIAGDLQRSEIRVLTRGDAVRKENVWLRANEHHNGQVRQAYTFAGRTLQELQGMDFSEHQDPQQARQSELAKRREEYDSHFDVPENFEYSGRWPRPPVTWAREQHMARQAWLSPKSHVVMVVGSDHMDGIERALQDLAAGH